MSRNHLPSMPPFIIATILSLALTPGNTMATSAPSSLPQIDFDKMGTVGLGGAFSGLDWYSSESSSSSSSSTSTAPPFSSDGATLFYRGSDGTFRALGGTNAGGLINSLCWSNSSASTSSTNGTLYFGGSFSSISGTTANNVAAYSISDNTFAALSTGVTGEVNAVYCDNANEEVWLGGSFTAPSGSGGNVALWSTSSGSWQTPDFGGFNGPVQSISVSTNGSSIYFGGDFTTTFVSNASSLVNSTSLTNSTSSVGSAPANTSTVGNSGYLTPLSVQASTESGSYFQIQAGPSTDQTEYSNADVLLCPGSGVWLAEDNTVSNVDLYGEGYLPATGVRMVNGLVEGRGATNFCFTALPDYTQLNMTYTDPTTGKNATCYSHCPIYTDSATGAQDYIFTDGARNITGFQIQLKGWIGDGAGLSSVSMLTDGAYAMATTAPNSGTSCSSGNSSSVQTAGDWTTKSVTTSNPDTTNYYLSSVVSVNNPTYPKVIFYPEVSSSGTYDVYILIPGCKNTGDCNSRTSVDIEVFPLQGGLGWTSTISEQVQYDTKTLVYSGAVDASSDVFTPTISLALASSPAAVSSGSKYTVVADRVQLTLTSISGSANSGSSSATASGTTGINGTTSLNITSATNSSYAVSFGVFEWARSSKLDINAASSYLSNNTETALTRLGFSLDAALNASGSAATWTVNTIVSLDNTVFVGGDFSASNNYTNVLSIDTASGQASALASQGLSGMVNTAAVVDEYVFFGGDFTSTAASGGVALNYVARYDPKSKAWAAVGGGVNGYVTDLLPSASSSTQLIVLGNFTSVVSASGTSTSSGGYAVWDTSSSSWSSTGVVFGNVSAGTATSSSTATYFAGKVYGSSSNGVSGVAMLSSGDDGSATISSLSGVAFGPSGSAPSPSPSTASKRSIYSDHGSYTRTWLSRFTDAIVERASPVLSGRATAPTITSLPAVAPAVLAGTFWTNSSASGKPTITILGGNFTSGSGSSELEGVAFYSSATSSLTGPSPAVTGVVRTLDVVGDVVYVGGQEVSVDGVGEGLVVYDLRKGAWLTGGMPSLGASSDFNVTVNAIRLRTNTNTVVVAGNFATAGSLSCVALCLWDSGDAQWSTPGSGLASGEVRAVDFAGDSYDTLIAAGSFVLSTGDVAYVASYTFDNSSWTSLGSLPGPALAVAVDDKNATNIFAAGYSASDGSPYFQRWDGATWTAQNETYLESGSIIQQLAFVPMSSEHAAKGSIENDRMLMVSGDLYLEDSANVTSALYDGANWYPYLVASSSTGGLGSASSLFWSDSSFSYEVRHYLARGLVVLVAIAIATGLILVFVLFAFLIAYCTRRRERKNNAVQREMYEKDGRGDGDAASDDVSSTHQHVFNNVQAALAASLVGGGLGAAGAAGARRSDPSSYDSHVYPIGSDEAYHDGDDDEGEGEEEEGRETTMRYDFTGDELQEGELPMKAGQMIVILDDEQSHEWWYARDPATGREGVVPATYVW